VTSWDYLPRYGIRALARCTLLSAALLAFASNAYSQATVKQPPAKAAQAETARPASGYTLVIDGDIDPEFAPIVGRLAALYYESYSKLVARFEHPERPAPRKIRVTF